MEYIWFTENHAGNIYYSWSNEVPKFIKKDVSREHVLNIDQ